MYPEPKREPFRSLKPRTRQVLVFHRDPGNPTPRLGEIALLKIRTARRRERRCGKPCWHEAKSRCHYEHAAEARVRFSKKKGTARWRDRNFCRARWDPRKRRWQNVHHAAARARFLMKGHTARWRERPTCPKCMPCYEICRQCKQKPISAPHRAAPPASGMIAAASWRYRTST